MSALPPSATLWKRMMALLYDSLAVLTVVYFAAFIPVVASGGEAIPPGNELFTAYLVLVLFGYFGICWTRGRTLGMLAWKMLIVTDPGGRRPGWGTALLRFAAAAVSLGLCGLGYLAAYADRDRRTLHDRLSRTRIIAEVLKPPADS